MLRRALSTSVLMCATCFGGASSVAAEVNVAIHYIKQEVEAPPTLSNLDPVPEDLGQMGAELGLSDNITTGRFLGQNYELTVTVVPPGDDYAAAVQAALAESDLIVLEIGRAHV